MPVQSVVKTKGKPPEEVGATNFPSDKQIKTKFSLLKQSFKKASEDI